MSISDEHSHTQINGNASTAGVGQTLLAYTDLNCLIFCTDCSLVFRDPQKSPTPQLIWLQENLSLLFFKEVHSPYDWGKCDFCFFLRNTKPKQTKTQPKQTNKPQKNPTKPRQLRVPYASKLSFWDFLIFHEASTLQGGKQSFSMHYLAVLTIHNGRHSGLMCQDHIGG